MEQTEFLKKLKIELKISKNSDYTIRNYITSNKALLDFTKKQPDKTTTEDIKLFLAENLSDKAATSTILFLSAIKYAYKSIFNNDITAPIKRPKKEQAIQKETFSYS